MLRIRLARAGAKNRPFYHIVLIDGRHAQKSGNFIVRLGYYDPGAKGTPEDLRLDLEATAKWMSQGAQPSERVHQLIKNAKKTAITQPLDATAA